MTLADADAHTRTNYAKSVAIRQRVLDAFIIAFGQSGFRATTTKDIAAPARMSPAGLLRRFPTTPRA